MPTAVSFFRWFRPATAIGLLFVFMLIAPTTNERIPPASLDQAPQILFEVWQELDADAGGAAG